MQNIILIGFMGSGKSTIGKILAEKLELNWMDMDIEIENQENKTIEEIFNDNGEDYFRHLETEQLKKLINKENNVLSTGGGVVLKEENRIILKEIGRVIFLHADCEQIINNLKESSDRPLLKGNNPEEKIVRLLDERESTYLNTADIIIQTTGKTVENIVDEIISLL